METKTVLLSGVGGQGIILASDVLSMVAMEEGLDVKKSEVHGMSQRGGQVVSTVRFGEKVYSPIVGPGMADFLFSLEKLEALRNVDYLKPNGIAVVSDYRFDPLPVAAGLADYPENVIGKIKEMVKNVHIVHALDLAFEAGTIRVMNVVMLGALSKFLPFKKDTWFRVIEKRVPPRFVDMNKRAFELGLNAV